jgi:hypothetical protein
VANNTRVSISFSGDQPMYKHQQEIVDYFDKAEYGALGCQMGTGKSRMLLEIAARKRRRQKINEKEYKMTRNSLTIPTSQKSCIEEDIYIENIGVLKYSISNSLDDISIAVITRTGHYIDLEKAVWKLNLELSTSVKQLMNSYNVNYSMTTFINSEKVKHLVINMRTGNNWYLTGYEKIEGEFISWELIRTNAMAYKMAKNVLIKYISSVEGAENDDE